MRRVTALFGGECKLNDIGRETNTLISDMTTVICLDDFHSTTVLAARFPVSSPFYTPSTAPCDRCSMLARLVRRR